MQTSEAIAAQGGMMNVRQAERVTSHPTILGRVKHWLTEHRYSMLDTMLIGAVAIFMVHIIG